MTVAELGAVDDTEITVADAEEVASLVLCATCEVDVDVAGEEVALAIVDALATDDEDGATVDVLTAEADSDVLAAD